MGSTINKIRNAQIVALTICVIVSATYLITTPALARDNTFNRNANDMAQLDDPETIPDRQVFDGYEAIKDSMPTSANVETNSVSRSYQATLEARLSDMEKQIRDLTGKLEEISFENTNLKNKLEKSQTDFEMRLNELQNKQSAPQAAEPVTGTTPSTPTNTLSADDVSDVKNETTPSEPTAVATPEQKLGTLTKAPNGATIPTDKKTDAAALYEEAYTSLKAGNAADAQTKFNDFIKQFPNHPLRSNAIYWLGETYYAEGNFAQSTRIFAESYKKFPKGPKAADSLLKMGMSLGQNNKTKEACVTFKQLKKEFTVGQAALLRRADAEMAKLSCK